MQALAEAQDTLRNVIQERVRNAIQKQEHDTVVRFVKLYAPLRMKVYDCILSLLLASSLHVDA